MPGLAPFLDRIGDASDIGKQCTFPIHVTASGLLFDPTRRSILLILHRTLEMWLQPGGHLEEGELPEVAARREVNEEVALDKLKKWGGTNLPFHIDIHPIPENKEKAQPPHHHCDFRYLFICSCNSVSEEPSEVAAAAWFPIHDKSALTPSLIPVVRLIDTSL